MIGVIIPAYNEDQHIEKVIRETQKTRYTVIIVDDGSKDTTTAIAQKTGATVLTHQVNLGKGAAVKTGCDYALTQGIDILVLMDADGQHKAEEIPRLVNALHTADLVIGYRTLNKDMPLVMRMGNWGINTISRMINGIQIKDTQSGFRAMRAETYKKIRWTSIDYGMESEMIGKCARAKLRVAQVPISTIYNDNFKGTTIFDGIKIVLRLLKWRLL